NKIPYFRGTARNPMTARARRPVQPAMKVLQMLTQSDSERECYQARLKAQRDQNAILKDAREEAMEQGQVLGRIHLCQRLLKLPLTPRGELLALPLVELQARAEALERQLGAAGS